MKIVVLYEDNHVIAVFKPAGILSQGDMTGQTSMFDEVKKYLKQKYKKPGKVFLGLVHRLDKPVSGIMLFAKTSKGAARLSEQFRNNKIQKTYYGIVFGRPKEEKGGIKEKVKKISLFAKGFTALPDKELLKEIKKATKTRTAELYYETVKYNDKYSLLKITPKTGRFHQIRIQFANMGNPILGDVKYGAPLLPHPSAKSGKSIALCATNLTFNSVTGNKRVNLSIKLPETWQEYLSTAKP